MEISHINPVWKIRAASLKRIKQHNRLTIPTSSSLTKTIKPNQNLQTKQTIIRLRHELDIKKSELERVKHSLEQKRNLSLKLIREQETTRQSLKEILIDNINSSRKQITKNIKLRKRQKQSQQTKPMIHSSQQNRCRLPSSINAQSQDQGNSIDPKLEESIVKILKSSESCQFHVKWVDIPSKFQ